MIDERELRKLLREDVGRIGGQAAWAERHGFSPQYVNDVLRGKSISAAVAKCLGYRRRLVYERKEQRA